MPGGVKPTYLKSHGHTVLNPKLDDEDFDEAVRVAQAEFDQHQPDVVVGSSRGGAVAMNIDSGDTPLVLLCPAWKRWRSATTTKTNTTILHSRADDVIPFEESVELVRKSGLPESALIEVGSDHRLADPEPLAKMLGACQSSGRHRQVMVVRVMVLADSAEAATPSAKFVREKIEAYGVVASHNIERYWKMPELFEIYFLLHLTSESCDPFNKVLDFLGEGWDRHFVDERQAWAVWTLEMGRFCTTDARWANVECFPASSLVNDESTTPLSGQ